MRIMTPRQQALADVLHIAYARRCSIIDATVIVAPHSRYLKSDIAANTLKRFEAEAQQFLDAGNILDYSDFESGGRYYRMLQEKKR